MNIKKRPTPPHSTSPQNGHPATTQWNARDFQGDTNFAILKVQEKFQPDLSDEEAEVHFMNLISESVTALFPVIVERLHKWAVYWR